VARFYAALRVRRLHARGSGPAEDTLRILLAEDNVASQALAAGLLRRDRHAVTIVDNGVAAVAAAITGDFDVVLMDIQMPVMSGLDATMEIRRHEVSTGTHIRIIAMTAHVMQADRARCLAAGVDDYLPKPIATEALRRALSRTAPAAGDAQSASFS
jgi:CheY-like chemotaxis protein